MKTAVVILLLALVASSMGKIFFEENFSDANTDAWKKRWFISENKKDEGTAGTFDLSAGRFTGPNPDQEKGLHTKDNASFYTISAPFDEKFSNKGMDIVIQFSVKHEQIIDCGGGYVKLTPSTVKPRTFNGDSEYNIMFGPDICGSGHKIVHFILGKNGENHLVTRNPAAMSDDLTHTYTLLLKQDNTYVIYVDAENVQEGDIEEDFNILPPKTIDDPEVTKPEDWVDEVMIDDPEDVKPADWDDQPETINDPDAAKPEDWDDDLDGEWEASQIPNPEYKGPWRPRRIENPDYKGPWKQPQIPNPEYQEDPELYAFDDFSALGIEIWQVKAGSIFSNFLITDDLDLALERAKAINELREAEAETRKAIDEKEKAEALAEAEAKKAAAEAEDEEEEQDEL